jgi:hypothetical protein
MTACRYKGRMNIVGQPHPRSCISLEGFEIRYHDIIKLRAHFQMKTQHLHPSNPASPSHASMGEQTWGIEIPVI